MKKTALILLFLLCSFAGRARTGEMMERYNIYGVLDLTREEEGFEGN